MTEHEQENEPQHTMTFLEHLEELRQRLIKCIIAVVIGIFVCWFFREEIRQFLEAPLYDAWRSVPGLPKPSPLSFKSLMEPFVAYLKIAAIGGVFFASPVLFYHLWRFVSPGLYSKEKRVALPFVFISSILFCVGSAGAYAYVFPIGFSFFLQFSSGGTVETLRSDPIAMIESDSVAKAVEAKKSAKEKSSASKIGAGKKTAGSKESKKENSPRSTAKSTPSVGKWERVQKWYQWLERRLMGTNCGEFVTSRQEDGVRLQYRFSVKQCGDAPSTMSLIKNGRDISLKMMAESESTDTIVFAVVDKTASAVTGRYELNVVHSASKKLAPVLMIKDYLDFAIKLLLAFGLVFELPVLIFFLAYAGIVDHVQLLKFGRWFVVLSVTFAAILTPPDVVTQIMLATPLVILYYLSILVVFLMGKKRTDE